VFSVLDRGGVTFWACFRCVVVFIPFRIVCFRCDPFCWYVRVFFVVFDIFCFFFLLENRPFGSSLVAVPVCSLWSLSRIVDEARVVI